MGYTAAKAGGGATIMRLLQRTALALLAITALPGAAPAQDYPNRSITLLVPLAPGGGMDFIARTIGAKLSERVGRPVLVENRPGGGTIVATVALAKAPPDGYTLLLVPAPTLTTNAVVYKSLPYDPIKDFAPIALTSQVAFTLVVNPSLPIHSVADLIKYAQRQARRADRGNWTCGCSHPPPSYWPTRPASRSGAYTIAAVRRR